MKVTLLFPKVITESPAFSPLGILYVAAVLKEGHQIQVIDDHLERSPLPQLLDKVERFAPQAVGISCNILQVNETYRLARAIKERLPVALIVVGGSHVTAAPEEMLAQCPAIDLCVVGEGERTAVELVEALAAGVDWRPIEGIVYRDGDGKVVRTPPRLLLPNLDEIPFPAYDMVDVTRYHAYPILSLLDSRGCPFNCIFCSNPVFGRRTRRRSLANITAEIDLLVERYGCRAVHFWDDTFNLQSEAVVELCDEFIRRNYHRRLKWACECRVNRKLVSLELFQKMREAGCVLVGFGIEAGNQGILDNIRKKTTIAEIEEAVALAHSAGLKTRGLFMVGNLGETVETIFDTIKLARRLPLDSAQFSICTPTPGSDFHRIAEEKNWVLNRDYSLYTQRYPTVRNEALSTSQIAALKNVADFVMLTKGADVDIFAVLLPGEMAAKKRGASVPKLLLRRLAYTRHWLKSFYYLIRYYAYRPKTSLAERATSAGNDGLTRL